MTENDIVNSYDPGRASAANQRLMAYCGVASLVVLLVGMWAIAGFVPPPGPNQTLQQIVAVYTHHGVRIRFGLIVACAASDEDRAFATLAHLGEQPIRIGHVEAGHREVRYVKRP